MTDKITGSSSELQICDGLKIQVMVTEGEDEDRQHTQNTNAFMEALGKDATAVTSSAPRKTATTRER